MKTGLFHFDLPEELIAQKPLSDREGSRLLVVNRENRTTTHCQFRDVIEIFDENDVLVLNQSRVIPARIPLSEKREMFLSECISENHWRCMVRTGKKFSVGTEISFSDGSSAKVLSVLADGLREIEFFPQNNDFSAFLEKYGEIPLPPYIKRSPNASDSNRYQTVFSRVLGSVAAPTAGLHFSEDILSALKEEGVQIEYVTLHVGLGTFLPVKADELQEHKMHREYFEIDSCTAERLNSAKKIGKKITAIGSTALRTLESAVGESGYLKNFSGKTDIFIYPPAEFLFVDHFFTNFHLPKSTLIMLVSAFASPGKTHGTEFVLKVYQEAIREKYRFFSYGDATLWW